MGWDCLGLNMWVMSLIQDLQGNLCTYVLSKHNLETTNYLIELVLGDILYPVSCTLKLQMVEGKG